MITTQTPPQSRGSIMERSMIDRNNNINTNITTLVYKAKMAQHAERFEEMVSYMKRIAESHKSVLNVEERNLLSVAYKKVVGTRRASWRLIFSLENKERQAVQVAKKEWEKEQLNPSLMSSSPPSDTKKTPRATQLQQRLTTAQAQLTACHEYRLKIEHEAVQLCQEALSLLGNHLIPTINADIAVAVPGMMEIAMNPIQGRVGVPSRVVAPPAFEESLQQQLTTFETKSHSLTTCGYGESLVFYYKMMGDYRRYLAEFAADSEAERISQSLHALGSYFVASHIAKTQLAPTHPIRLGLALNFSVFYYEVMAGPARACQIAKHAFDEALAELNDLSEDTYRDSTLIMQLLKDNLTLWTSTA